MNINYENSDEPCLTEVYENQHTLETAMKWAKESDGILTFSFHWFSPMGGHDKSFYAVNTDFDATRVLIDGTLERKAFFHDMDVIAEQLKLFRDADIPVLWHPFHESDGDWFWWGAKGPETARELYKLMFDHYTNVHHLDNLLWVWNCRLPEGYPGDEFVDVVSVDIYMQKQIIMMITVNLLRQPPGIKWRLLQKSDICRIFICWSSPTHHGHII